MGGSRQISTARPVLTRPLPCDTSADGAGAGAALELTNLSQTTENLEAGVSEAIDDMHTGASWCGEWAEWVSRRVVVSMHSDARNSWDLVVAAGMAYLFIFMPYTLAFYFDGGAPLFYQIMDLLVDYIFYLDICFNFLTTFEDEDYQEVWDIISISRHYLKVRPWKGRETTEAGEGRERWGMISMPLHPTCLNA